MLERPIRRFTYVTVHSPTLPSFYVRHSSFYNSSVASPTPQALHLRLLPSRPWYAIVYTLILYLGWFFSFGTNASVLSCNNVGRCHFYRRLLTCIPSLRACDLACPRHRSCAVAPVRWVVGCQRSRKTVEMFSKQEQITWIKIQCARGRTAKQCHRGL